MLLIYYYTTPYFWIIPWILQSIGYYRLMKKMGQSGYWAIAPFLAEYRLTSILFKSMRTFWHPAIMAAIYLAGGFYLRSAGDTTSTVVGMVLTLLALIVYGIFLIRLYIRLCKSFHKGFFFTLGMICIPVVFLLLLSRDKEQFYGGPTFKQSRFLSRPVRIVINIVRELVYLACVAVVLFTVTFLTMRLYMPRPVVMLMHQDINNKIKDVVGDGNLVSREDMMGDDYAYFASMPTSRDKFFPDHSNDQEVIVFEYIIGSNLEDNSGLSSLNIDQMIKATEAGPHLKFVIEAGGSRRWFTSGIPDNSVGRYEIADGKVTPVMSRDSSISMSDPAELYDFLAWAAENYDADRQMLVFWDHGGGWGTGYGQDQINRRSDPGPYGTLMVDEIAEAIRNSGMKFDLIGFDACLMQHAEIARVMEPYADYYLGSEEVESGEGWYYTSAFSMLAKDPTVSTEDFGREMVSSFDVYNTVLHGESSAKRSTLSLLDLTRITPAFDKLMELYVKEDAAIREDPANYADISIAAQNAYTFSNKEQVDLIGYLYHLGRLDYDESILTAEEIQEMVRYFQAAIVCRNAASNDGVNGLAMTFPYNNIDSYRYDHDQYVYFDMTPAKTLYDDYFSIMAYQKKDEYSQPVEVFGIPIMEAHDYTTEEWYVKGFEDYVNVPYIVDIPLEQTDKGWKLQLPDEVWKIIADSQQIMYQKCEEGWRYLGRDVPGSLDEEGHPMVSSDGTWIHINDVLVCYEDEDPVTNDSGVIYKGTVRAVLNGEYNIILSIEWDPVTEESEQEVEGHVTGYQFADNESSHLEKGIQELKPNDTIEFLFDYYDENGDLIKTETYGKTIRVSSMSNLTVEDRPLGECDIRYGITLTDVYQRTFITEMMESHISE